MEQQGYRNRNGMIAYAPYLIPGGILHLGHRGNQTRMMSAQDAHAYVPDHHLINRNGMIPPYLIPGGILHLGHSGNQPRMMNAQHAQAYVLDQHFILNQHNIGQVNQQQYNTSSAYAYHAQDGHFIFDENIRPVNHQVQPPRVSTRNASSAYGHYVQDDVFIIDENISQVNQQVPKRRDIGAYANLERIIIQQVPTDAEAMTCSICLADFSVGLEAIRLPSPCLHVYHKECILEWFDRSSSCPLCRRSIL